MSTSDAFLPVEGEPDVLTGEPTADAADEPPVAEHTVFRTPTGESADPAND